MKLLNAAPGFSPQLLSTLDRGNSPITKASLSCPCELYHGGRPAVYRVRLAVCTTRVALVAFVA